MLDLGLAVQIYMGINGVQVVHYPAVEDAMETVVDAADADLHVAIHVN